MFLSFKDNIEKNKEFDHESIRISHYNFRDRDLNKEIQPGMRFTSKTDLERIEDFIKKNMQTQVQVFLMLIENDQNFWRKKKLGASLDTENMRGTELILLCVISEKEHF